MKRRITTTLLTAVALTIPVWAQTDQSGAQTKENQSSATSAQSQPGTQNPQSPSASETSQAQQNQQGSLVDATQLEEKKVFDTNGQQIGQLKHVLLDSKTGRARYGVVQVDKAWNFNDPEVVIPWGAFEVRAKSDNDHAIILDASKDKLDKAPRFDKNRMNELSQRTQAEPIFSYWAVIWIDEMDPEQSGTAQQPATGQPSGTAQQPESDQRSGTAQQPGASREFGSRQPGNIQPGDPEERSSQQSTGTVGTENVTESTSSTTKTQSSQPSPPATNQTETNELQNRPSDQQ